MGVAERNPRLDVQQVSVRTRPACGTELKSTRIPKHFPTAIAFPDRNWELPGERVDDAAL